MQLLRRLFAALALLLVAAGGLAVTPNNDSYAVPSGTDVYAGRNAPNNPSWYLAIASGQWGTLPNSQLSTSGVQQTFDGSSVDGVFAYSGAIVNHTGLYIGATWTPGTFLVVWGGGHSDYGGNEVYAYGPLETNSPAWHRLRDRTEPYPINVARSGSNPVSRHTYNTITYIADGTRNWMFSAGYLVRYNDANGGVESDRFDFAQASPNTIQPWASRANAPDGMFLTVHETSSNRVWAVPISNGRVSYYDVAANTWTDSLFKSPMAMPTGASTAIDQSRGLWMLRGTGAIQFFRTNNGVDNDYYTPSTTGTAPTGAGGTLWDPIADRFVVWNGNGRQLHFLSPPATSPYQGGNAWAWTSTTPSAGATPSSINTSGTVHGRFSYVPGEFIRGYILLNINTGSVYFYRP